MPIANGTNGNAHQGNNGLNVDAPRFEGVVRPYSDADVAKLQGSLKIEHTLANEGAKKLWVRAAGSCMTLCQPRCQMYHSSADAAVGLLVGIFGTLAPECLCRVRAARRSHATFRKLVDARNGQVLHLVCALEVRLRSEELQSAKGRVAMSAGAAAQRAVCALPGRHDRQPGHAAGAPSVTPCRRCLDRLVINACGIAAPEWWHHC